MSYDSRPRYNWLGLYGGMQVVWEVATTKVCGTRLAMAAAMEVVLAMVAMAHQAMVAATTTVVIKHLVAMDSLTHTASSTVAVVSNGVMLLLINYH